MRPAFRFQVPVGVRAVHGQRRAPEARFIAGGRLEELGLEAAPFGPAEVHPDEHLRPVRRVGPADAGADRDDGIPLVVRSGELGLERGVLHLVGEGREFRGDLRIEIWIGRCERGELGEILGARAKSLPAVDARAYVSEALQDLLRALPVLPEVRLGGFAL